MLHTRALPQFVSGGEFSMRATLAAFAAACFIGAFITDLVYWRSMSFIWETFSVWLLTAGLVLAALTAIAGMITFAANPDHRRLPSTWIYGAGYAAVIVLSVVNAFVYSRDGYTAVVPTGLVLSGTVVLVLMVIAWLGRALVYRNRVGVSE
jgi:uncharacterized membrane protein